jgi:hypothetical protein
MCGCNESCKGCIVFSLTCCELVDISSCGDDGDFHVIRERSWGCVGCGGECDQCKREDRLSTHFGLKMEDLVIDRSQRIVPEMMSDCFPRLKEEEAK